ncbi:MAG: carboxypeptidase-like regulatory domain-containing protein [Planctomycetota bacterium]
MHTSLGSVLLFAAAGATAATAQQQPAPQQPSPWTGRVVDVRGEPIPAARIVALAPDGRIAGRTATDAEGVYRLGRGSSDEADLRVEAPGYLPGLRSWHGPTTPRTHNFVLEPSCRLSGRLSGPAGEALGDAEVLVVSALGVQRARTDAEGRYTIATAPLRRVRVRAWNGSRYGDADLALRGDREQDLVLDRTAFVRDVVISGANAGTAIPGAALPVEGAFVRAFGQAMVLLPDCGQTELTATSGDLRATLVWSDKSDVLLTPTVPGFVVRPEGRIVSPIRRRLPIEFVAEPDADRDRMVLTGEITSYRKGQVAAQKLVVRDISGVVVGKTRTDERGRFRIEGFVPKKRALRVGMPLGSWYLLSQLEGDRPVLREGFTWDEWPDPTQPLELVAEPCATLDAAVQDDDGVLLTLADVTVVEPETTWRALLHSATDAAGRCHLSLPPGKYVLVVVGHDGRVVQGTAEFPAAPREAQVQWRTLATGTVEGTVVCPNAGALAGVEVMLRHESVVLEMPVPLPDRLLVRVRTDRDGRFRCRGLPTGDWIATVIGRQDLAGATFAVAKGETKALQLGR